MSVTAVAPPSPAPISRATAWKIVGSVVVVAGAVGYLLYASVQSGAQYYKHVDEVAANLDSLRGKKLQVHGNVVDGSIEVQKGTLAYRFQVESRSPRTHAVMPVTFTGIVPDTFKSGAEVVADGFIAEDNHLVADRVEAKCPSKYKADGTPKPNTGVTAAGTN